MDAARAVNDQDVTVRLAAHLAALDPAEFADDVIAAARACLLDSLGGTRVREVALAVRLVLGWGQNPEAMVPGLSGRYPAPLAAYAAAQFANALDYDDTVLGVGHPGAAIIATALAVGQSRPGNGSNLPRAIVAGYEASVRIGRAIAPSRERGRAVRGHPWAVFGATAAAAALLGLDADATAEAFGLAAQHALVPTVGKWYDRPISPLKNNYGWAAAGGILAATLVAEGVRTQRGVLDGETGFWVMASSDRWQPDGALAGLGADFAIRQVEFKPFAACRYMQTALDALSQILARNRPEPAAVREVVVKAAARAHVFADYAPMTLLDAQFSLPFASAALLLGRPLTEFAPDHELADLARRVRIETDPEAERQASFAGLPATVELRLADDTVLTVRVDVPPGDPSRPLGADDLRQKFLDLATPVLGPDGARDLHDLICIVPGFPSATDLARRLAPSAAAIGATAR
jgi:2-methylcitrate dehydratase PrpD